MIKNDQYKKARGTWSRILNISCHECGEHICFYQKDGSGDLRRMYIDRCIDSGVSLKGKELRCLNSHVLGVRVIYEKEERFAYRLFVDAVDKKIVKSSEV